MFASPLTGSIAHTNRLAAGLASDAATGVGLDLEDGAVRDDARRIMVRTRSEGRLWDDGAPARRELHSMKEAAFKSLDADQQAQVGGLFWRLPLALRGDGWRVDHPGLPDVRVVARTSRRLTIAVAVRP